MSLQSQWSVPDPQKPWWSFLDRPKWPRMHWSHCPRRIFVVRFRFGKFFMSDKSCFHWKVSMRFVIKLWWTNAYADVSSFDRIGKTFKFPFWQKIKVWTRFHPPHLPLCEEEWQLTTPLTVVIWRRRRCWQMLCGTRTSIWCKHRHYHHFPSINLIGAQPKLDSQVIIRGITG